MTLLPTQRLSDEAETDLHQTIRAWLADWGELWGYSMLARDARVEFSRRLKRSLGRAYPERRLIRLNAQLIDEPDAADLREILCHEAAHLAVFNRHGRTAKPHGPEWRELVRMAGFQPATRLSIGPIRMGKPTGKPGLLFVHRCPECGALRLAKKAMPTWRCVGCVEAGREGRLEITTQPRERGNPSE